MASAEISQLLDHFWILTFSRLHTHNYGLWRLQNSHGLIVLIFASIIRDMIVERFVIKKLFASRQFAVLKGCSTVTALVQILGDRSEAVEVGGRIDFTYANFERHSIQYLTVNY